MAAGRARQGGLRGGKGGVWEGGLRVPMIVRGPGIATDTWCHVPVVGYDLFPTFCQWAGVAKQDIPPTIEGGSLHGLLSNDGQSAVGRRSPALVFHFPHYQSEGPQSAILLGPLKLVHFYETNSDMLFDLSQDLSERNDLSTKLPQETAALRQQLDEYLAAVNAQLPTTNANYNPNASRAAEPPRGQP